MFKEILGQFPALFVATKPDVFNKIFSGCVYCDQNCHLFLSKAKCDQT